jgi:hypothetical protein
VEVIKVVPSGAQQITVEPGDRSGEIGFRQGDLLARPGGAQLVETDQAAHDIVHGSVQRTRDDNGAVTDVHNSDA